MSDKHAAGKGSKYRSVDRKSYSENYEKIFGKKKSNINPPIKKKDKS